MALVVLQSGRRLEISAEKGRALWDVLTTKTEGDAAQQQFAGTVAKLYLNWRNAPDDYLLKYKQQFRDTVFSCWMVDQKGTPSRPEPKDADCIRVSKLFGMISPIPVTKLPPPPADFTQSQNA